MSSRLALYFLFSEITATEKREKAMSFGKLQVWYNNPLTSKVQKINWGENAGWENRWER